MKVIAISKEPFNAETVNGVTNIAYNGSTYVLTTGTSTKTFSASDYIIRII